MDSTDPGTRLSRANTGRERLGIGRFSLVLALLIQGLATGFFSWGLWSGLFGIGIEPGTQPLHTFIQAFSGIGLIVGTATGLYYLRASERRMDRLGSQMEAATGNYQNHLEQLFRDWQLSSSERAVAVFAMKGFSNAEIAELRKTSVPTVKSQMKAIFRKAGLENRQQLIAYLVEELLSGVVLKNSDDETPAEPNT